MFEEVIEKIIKMREDDEFGFEICKIDDNEIEHAIGVKCIPAFDSTLVITGNFGGGFNMIFETSFNIVDRENILREIVNEEFAIELILATLSAKR